MRQQKKRFHLTLLEGDEKEELFGRIEGFNDIIADEAKLKWKWEEYVGRQYPLYLNYWSPLSFVNNRYARAALKRIGGHMINKRGVSLYLNLMRCEAHRDMSEEVLKKNLKK